MYVNCRPSASKVKVTNCTGYKAKKFAPKAEWTICNNWITWCCLHYRVVVRPGNCNSNYNAFRHDQNRYGGSVLIYVKDIYTTSEAPRYLYWLGNYYYYYFVYKLEIVKHALACHFLSTPSTSVIFVHIWSHSTLPSILPFILLGILKWIL